ncbi:MAG TPA: MFS transporter [Jiangellales bacterium]|nr:MFS transporter [Jiangellales bacterium]
MSPTFRSLRIRDYRLFWSGMAVSNVGTWMQRVAQDWLVLVLSGGSGAALGITTGLQFLPFLLVAPFGGLLADRLPKRYLLMGTNAFMGALAVLLGVLSITGIAQVWHVYVLAFLLGVGTALDNPARQSFVADIVGTDDVANAVALNSASFNAARMVGPATAGLLIAAFGPGPVFLVNALTFAGPLVALALMRGAGAVVTDTVQRRPGMIRDALRYVRRRPDIVGVLAILFFVGTFGLNFQLTTALMATEVFGLGAGAYGLLGSIMAIGSLAGSLLAARRGRPRRRVVVGAAVAFGLLEIAAGLMPTYWLFALSLVPVGMAALTFITTANAYVQTSVSPAVRGRVMALYLMVFMGGTPLGAPVIGWVGEQFGARWSVAGGGAIALVGTLAATAVMLRRTGEVVRPGRWPQLRSSAGSAAGTAPVEQPRTAA